MSRPASSEGFGGGTGSLMGSLGLIALGTAVLLGAIWFGVTSGAGQLTPYLPRHWDDQVGEWAIKSMLDEDNPCRDSAMETWLKKVGPKLVEQVQGEAFEYRWHVIDDDTPNAFALPGGWVGVHRGLFRVAERPEEVAGVIAHEIIHSEQRHGMQRMVGSLGVQILMSLAFGGSDLSLLAGTGMDLLMLSHSRDQETEADVLGRALMVEAGIDPEGMASIFETFALEAGKGGKMPTLLSSHPDSKGRAALARQGERPYRPIELPPLPSSNCGAAEADEKGTRGEQ
jgi:predicted Zn-dependent protease